MKILDKTEISIFVLWFCFQMQPLQSQVTMCIVDVSLIKHVELCNNMYMLH